MRTRSARGDFEEAVRRDPDFDPARFYLAENLLRINRVEDAARHLNLLRARLPNNLLVRLADDLSKLPAKATDDEARSVFANLAQPLMALSKCPDFVVNRGHYFGTGYGRGQPLSDADKRSLIEFLKTF